MTGGVRQSRSVAIFDLDHGVLDTPAPKLFTSHLISPGRDFEAFIERLVDTVASFVPQRSAAGLFASALKGTAPEAVRYAGKVIAAEATLTPHASVVMDEHRRSHRRLVATTVIPFRAAKPLTEALGFDAVIATRFGADDDGLDGTIDGPVVWGRGKLHAVREWAAGNGASLRRSYFYSGALSDAALLAEVGRPVVCDPDPRLAALAWLKGWPTRSLRAPAGVARIAGRELQEWIRPFSRPEFVPYAHFEFSDLEHIPESGPAIVCGNHRSYFDSIAVGLAISRRGRVARFLGKKEVFDVPVVGAIGRAAGGIRVERGTGSDEPLKAAAAALEAGELICLMPQGTIPRGPAFFEPELRGRWGAARLAAMTKAPVIPLGLSGTEKVWPRSSRLPNLNPLNRPLVTVRAGPAVSLTYDNPETDTKSIMADIVELLPEEAKVRREPTAEELRRTYPPGYKGDPAREAERRPGVDT